MIIFPFILYKNQFNEFFSYSLICYQWSREICCFSEKKNRPPFFRTDIFVYTNFFIFANFLWLSIITTTHRNFFIISSSEYCSEKYFFISFAIIFHSQPNFGWNITSFSLLYHFTCYIFNGRQIKPFNLFEWLLWQCSSYLHTFI